MNVSGEKKYLYEKCSTCIYADFVVAKGLHPDYGWWVQICKIPGEKCKPTKAQLSLFDE